MANEVIRQAAQKSGVRLWQIAYAVGVNDSTFSRRMRTELPKEDQKIILDVIAKIASGGEGVGSDA